MEEGEGGGGGGGGRGEGEGERGGERGGEEEGGRGGCGKTKPAWRRRQRTFATFAGERVFFRVLWRLFSRTPGANNI